MCADSKISALSEATALTGTEDMVVVQTSTKRVGVDTLFSTANATWQGWTMLTAPLTSTSWDGDARSTTAKTVIDLSAVFAVPAAVKAVLVLGNVRDSASVATYSYMILAPNNTADQGFIFPANSGVADRYNPGNGVIPCDANGDVYFQVVASGANTLDAVLQIWGYLR
jgi:hypothetical protein